MIQGADTLLESPISFLKMSDGVYLSRSNLAEARYIANLVRELLQRETGLSLGIVAFSEAQQGAIEQALEDLASSDSAFATRLEREYVREDAGQFNGLFVKNLENVQGDERDVIILSICYAPGPNGKMLMNFGPINQRGGEKRLNVIFSRARKRMAIVSSIESEAITNTHNDGAAALRAFLQFAQASATGDAPRSQGILANLNPGAKQSFAVSLPKDHLRSANTSASAYCWTATPQRPRTCVSATSSARRCCAVSAGRSSTCLAMTGCAIRRTYSIASNRSCEVRKHLRCQNRNR